MQGIRSIIARGALCAVLLTVSAPSALACGNMYLYPMLFLAYSEAGRAFDAERLARRSGEVSAAVWSSELGLTYHQWSLMRARKVLTRLARRLHQAGDAGQSGVALSIMLADEVYLAELHTKSRAVGLKPLRLGHPKSNISLYTTANALRALLNGSVRWSEAVEKDLVVIGPEQQQQKLASLFNTALSQSE